MFVQYQEKNPHVILRVKISNLSKMFYVYTFNIFWNTPILCIMPDITLNYIYFLNDASCKNYPIYYLTN